MEVRGTGHRVPGGDINVHKYSEAPDCALSSLTLLEVTRSWE